ncbi:MAG TPA: AMP-binding protein [Burkholderiaceae bacterium]|nr:AMP-binding protein [Burkholderiaceae bacterium]
MNLFSLLDQTATRYPDLGAVFHGIDQVLTWSELRSRALCLGSGIRKRCGTGERIALVSENRPEYVELMFSAWAAEAAIVPINYKLHDREVAQILEDAEVSLVFVSPTLLPGLQRTAAAYPGRIVVIAEAEYAALLATEPLSPPDSDPQALAWLFYTSGTTGRSKGAMLSHRNLLAMEIAHLADIEVMNENTSQIHVAPMSHGSGLYILPSVARGARQVVPASGGFDPVEFLDLCDQHPSCGSFLAPTMVQRLRLTVESGKRGASKNLRCIVYGGGPMYVDELRKSTVALGPVFAQIYGQGESPMTITGLDRAGHAIDDDAILGSVGWPRSGVEVRVIGPDGAAVPAGAVGEIVCRGDVVMAGYWRNPTATAQALQGGWLRTGDMGSFDERGCLTLRDRSKDVVISGGSNIYPREVEEALLAHAGVIKTAVVGRPDPEWGEVVIAFVVCAPGANVTAADLDAHCLEYIARFKRPKEYRFLDELPTSSYGKVLKNELRKML